MLLFLMLVNGIVLSESLYPGRISVGRVITSGVGILFVFLGNIMPKIKNNFFMGLRNPWTLSDPDVWNRATAWEARSSSGPAWLSRSAGCCCPRRSPLPFS